MDATDSDRGSLSEEIDIPAGVSLSSVAGFIEEAGTAAGLRVTSREPIPGYPGSLRWRLKRGKEPGSLEVVLRNRERFLHLSVGSDRAAAWGREALSQMAGGLRERLRS